MTLLTIFYWILVLIIVIATFAPATQPHWVLASNVITIFLFVIIGLKLLKPEW